MSIINIADSRQTLKLFPWALVFALVLFALYTLAISRGETVNAMWLVTAAICVYASPIASIRSSSPSACCVSTRARTPAHRRNDGLDYVPTDKWVLFGHHFAAIAGAGPLVGPVLAAQMGYLPGTLWLLTGVVFAGAVQDFLVLFISTRRDGRSLGDLIKTEMGRAGGRRRHDRHSDDHDHSAGCAGARRRQGARRQSLGRVHRLRDAADRRLDGRLWPLHPRPGASAKCRSIGFVLLHRQHRLRPQRRGKRDARAALHLQGRDACLHADRLRFRRFRACRSGCCSRRATISRPS